jgi:hypothetical protein
MVAQPVASVVRDVLCAVAHRTHVVLTVGAGEPAHAPATDERVEPTRAVPETVGDVVFDGAVPTATGAAV